MKSSTVYYIIMVYNIVSFDVRCDWLDDVSHFISQNLNPHEVSTFIDENLKDKKQRNLRFVSERPNIIVSFISNLSIYEDSYEPWLTIIDTMSKSIVLYYTDDLQTAETLIASFLSAILPKRPKFMIIYCSYNPVLKNTVESILQFAWDNKFLDLTILIPENSTIMHYNPFYGKFYEIALNKEVNIFPDKLANGNRHSVKISNNFKPSLIIAKEKYRKIYLNSIVKMAFESLNFTFLPCPMGLGGEILSGPTIIDDDVEERGTALVPLYVNQESMVFLVPVLMDKEPVNILVIVIVEITLLFAVMKIFIWLMERLKITSDQMKEFDIVRLILSQSVPKQPRTSTGRIIYLTITTIFALYMSDIYMKLVEENFSYSEVSFESYEDLDKSQLPIGFSDWRIYIVMEHSENELLVNMINKTIYYMRMNDCVNELIKNQSIICMTYNREAVFYLNAGNNSKFMKVAKTPLVTSNVFLEFVLDSPYADKFYAVYQRVHEAGIVYAQALMEKTLETMESSQIEQQFDISFDKKKLLLVTFIGYSISLLIFLTMELLRFDLEQIKHVMRGFVSFFIIIIYTNEYMK